MRRRDYILEKVIWMLVAFVFVSYASCGGIKYKDDKGFLNSAQANSMEYMVKVNGSVCRDVDKKVGFCAKRIKSTHTVKFHHDARPYNYRFKLRCTSAIDSNFSQDVQSGKEFDFEIPPEKFKDVMSFSCIGEVFPHDRDPQEISSGWRVSVVIVDAEYDEREIIFKSPEGGKTYLVMGRHAKYSTVCDENGCQKFKEKTKIEVHGTVVAYSESYMSRWNYYGY